MAYTIIPPASGGTLSSLTGLTAKQLVFGAADGSATQSADVTYDDSTNDLTVSASESGGTVGLTVANTSNTASSAALILSQVAGASGGDPLLRLGVSGVTTWDWAIANATSDRLELRPNAGTSVLNVLTSGEVAIGGAPVASTQLAILGTAAVSAQLTTTANNNQATLTVGTASRSLFMVAYGASSAGNTGYGEAKANLCELSTSGITKMAFLTGQSTMQLMIENGNGVGVVTNSTNRAWVGGTVKTIHSDTGNVGAGEDNLHSYSLPAGSLAADGQSVEIETVVTFAANANSKQVKLYFGATVIYDSSAQVQNGGALIVRARVVRTGAATQRASAAGVGDAATPLFADSGQYTTPAETLSGAITIKVTGEAVNNNDIVNTMTIVRWVNAFN